MLSLCTNKLSKNSIYLKRIYEYTLTRQNLMHSQQLFLLCQLIYLRYNRGYSSSTKTISTLGFGAHRGRKTLFALSCTGVMALQRKVSCMAAKFLQKYIIPSKVFLLCVFAVLSNDH